MLILVAEDEPRISSFLHRGLTAEGYECVVAEDAESALAAVEANPVDLVLLDLLLPDRSGLDVLRALRARDPRLPVLILTALEGVDSKVSGLDLGADDYLTKPFAFEELLARIRALLRRERASAVVLRAGELVLDLKERSARGPGGQAALSMREFDLLEVFVRHPNEILSRARITSTIWPRGFDMESNVVDVYVGYLRRKVPWPPDVLLETVRGAGYRLKIG
ncbi:MAG TPA: response regulator transcription factor [Terriglobales bacterium]|nr:response regulator transcription factor [Terriglobales bacterium]